jgi:hypothetical protein
MAPYAYKAWEGGMGQEPRCVPSLIYGVGLPVSKEVFTADVFSGKRWNPLLIPTASLPIYMTG